MSIEHTITATTVATGLPDTTPPMVGAITQNWEEQWIATAQAAFANVGQGRSRSFIAHVSTRGLWITGLLAHTTTLHASVSELSDDFERRGLLYRDIFLNHGRGNFVVVPDEEGRIVGLRLG